MTFEAILKIIRDPSKTDWQKAADLHAGVISGAPPYTLETSAERAPRKARAIKPRPDDQSSSPTIASEID